MFSATVLIGTTILNDYEVIEVRTLSIIICGAYGLDLLEMLLYWVVILHGVLEHNISISYVLLFRK